MNKLEEIFSKSVGGLLDQGQQCASQNSERNPEYVGCSYRLKRDDGVYKCAAGHLIPDEDYNPVMEGKWVPDYHSPTFTGPVVEYFLPKYNDDELNLISRLQRIHDNNNRHISIEAMKVRFLSLYKEYGFNLPELEARLV